MHVQGALIGLPRRGGGAGDDNIDRGAIAAAAMQKRESTFSDAILVHSLIEQPLYLIHAVMSEDLCKENERKAPSVNVVMQLTVRNRFV